MSQAEYSEAGDVLLGAVLEKGMLAIDLEKHVLADNLETKMIATDLEKNMLMIKSKREQPEKYR